MKLSYVTIAMAIFSFPIFAMEPPLTPRSARIAQLEAQDAAKNIEIAQLRSSLDLIIAERNQERRLKELEDARSAQQAHALQVKQNNWSEILKDYSQVAGIKLAEAAQTAGVAYYLKQQIKELVPLLPINPVYQPLAQQVLPETAGLIAQGATLLTHKAIRTLTNSVDSHSLKHRTQQGLVLVKQGTVYIANEVGKATLDTARVFFSPVISAVAICLIATNLVNRTNSRNRQTQRERRRRQDIEHGWVVISRNELGI